MSRVRARALACKRAVDGFPIERWAYVIQDGPHQGMHWYASDNPASYDGTIVTVEYEPQDQFARRIP